MPHGNDITQYGKDMSDARDRGKDMCDARDPGKDIPGAVVLLEVCSP